MAKSKYFTAPVKSTKMPPGIPYIIGNEFAERFSFYGMRAILTVFMTTYLMGADGSLDVMTEENAKGWFHFFVFAVYFTPFVGALISDGLLGKYRTIILLSIVYCLGHLALALDETRLGLAVGLTLIAVGSGGIKPCVSAHVGDQFGDTNKHLIERVYGWFYFSINVGSMLSTLATPLLLEYYGPHIAFGVPGVLMFLATVLFWMGRYKFVHIPAGGLGFVKETFSPLGLKCLSKLVLIYVCVAPFWAMFDQTGSSWVLQAKNMDLHWLGITWTESQIQAANPIMVLIFIPLFSLFIYPTVNKFFTMTPLRKISIGLFLTVPSFLIIALIEHWIGQGYQPGIVWQILAYAVLTAAEVMVSITCLEFSYTQAPKTMKSIIMSFYLLSISFGNLFTSAVNFFIQRDDGTVILEGVDYFLFFSGVMLVAAIIFVFVAYFYKEQTFIHEEIELTDQPGVTDSRLMKPDATKST